MEKTPNLNTPIVQNLYRIQDDVRNELLKAVKSWISAPQANKNLMIRASRDLSQPYSTTMGVVAEETPTQPSKPNSSDAMKQIQLKNGIAAFRSMMEDTLQKSQVKSTKEALTQLLSAYESVLESLVKE